MGEVIRWPIIPIAVSSRIERGPAKTPTDNFEAYRRARTIFAGHITIDDLAGPYSHIYLRRFEEWAAEASAMPIGW